MKKANRVFIHFAFHGLPKGETAMTYIVTHWKTSATGLLTATVTVTGVLMQYHIVGPAAGSGTVVGLVGAIAAALLGLVARDPGK